VQFGVDTVLELKAVRNSLCRSYNMGYVGLYDCDFHLSLYMQTASVDVRMTPAKVLKICREHGEVIGEPETFKHIDGTLVSQVGHFRRSGARTGSRGERPAPNTQQRVATSNTNINPVGGEDLSHITLEGESTDKDECVDSDSVESDNTTSAVPDPLFVPVYSGYDGNWEIVSWNRYRKNYKRKSCSKYRELVLGRQSHKCAYCRCEVSFGTYSNADLDHVVPLHAGGESTLQNVHVLCTPCHRRKTSLESRRVSIKLSAMIAAAYVPNEECQ